MRNNVKQRNFNTRFAQDTKGTKLCVLCVFVFNSLVSETDIEH